MSLPSGEPGTSGPELTLHEALARTPPYRELDSEERASLAAVTRLRRFAAGETVFREGQPSDAFYTVAAGRVKIVKVAAGDKELILEIFGTGDPFGAVAAYEGIPFPATAVALEPAVVLSIGRREFFELLARQPRLTRALLLGLTRRLVELTQRLAQFSSGSVEYRIACLFLRLGQRLGRPSPEGLVVPLELSRQEIADLTATTPESAIRVMSRWSKAGIVLRADAGFVIADREALERLATA